jgi:phosphoserine phosphatase
MMQFHQKPALICFDMDGTLTKSNAWFIFNTLMGITPEYDETLFTQYMSGSLAYADWINLLRTEYKKVTRNRTEIESALFNVSYRDEVRETITALKTRGYMTAMITGGFDVTAFKVGQELGITHVIANTRCLFDPNDVFLDVVSYGEEGPCKVIHLEYLCTLLQLAPSDCVVVGDGSNDVGLFELTGNGVTFTTSSDSAKRAAAAEITNFNELLTILP